MSRFLQDCADFIAAQPFEIIRISQINDGGEIETIHCRRENPCQNIYSVAKAFTMTAIGLLYDTGAIKTEDRICEILADHLPKDGMDPRWHDVTVDMALTHRLGLPLGFLDIDVTHASAFGYDYLRYMLTTPLVYTPGSDSKYSDGAFYLLSRVVSAVTGEAMDNFLWRRLFYPLGFGEMAWSRCPMGYPMGATGLYISSEDMVKLGQVYLEGGTYRGRRILSSQWVNMALEREYGFEWDPAHRYFAKGGMRGQKLMVLPSAKRAIAVQACGANSDIIAQWIAEHSCCADPE